MKKIVYLLEQPFDERNFQRFGVQQWLDGGWAVEVWDITPYAHPNAWDLFKTSGRKLKVFDGYFLVESKQQIERNYLRVGEVSYFVDLTDSTITTFGLKVRFARMGAKRIICALGTTPAPNSAERNYFVSVFKKAIEDPPLKFLKRLANMLARKITDILIEPTLQVITGQSSLNEAMKVAKKRAIIKAHNFDYDIYLSIKNNCVRTDAPGRYAVFIDQNLCAHPDFIFQNDPYYTSPTQYFPALRKGFVKISGALNLALTIASHPRTPIQSAVVDNFTGYAVEYGKTAELIANCECVIGHYSTAIQFAVMFGKPIIFITTDELNSSPGKKYIEKYAHALGKKVINLDNNLDGVDWQIELEIDAKKYAEYKNKYIKIDGSEDKPYWNIVRNHLEEEAHFL